MARNKKLTTEETRTDIEGSTKPDWGCSCRDCNCKPKLDLVDESFGKMGSLIVELEDRLISLESNFTLHNKHPKPEPIPSTQPRRKNTYIVKKGDHLAAIAKKIFGVSGKFMEIVALNGIKDDNDLYEGLELDLPEN